MLEWVLKVDERGATIRRWGWKDIKKESRKRVIVRRKQKYNSCEVCSYKGLLKLRETKQRKACKSLLASIAFTEFHTEGHSRWNVLWNFLKKFCCGAGCPKDETLMALTQRFTVSARSYSHHPVWLSSICWIYLFIFFNCNAFMFVRAPFNLVCLCDGRREKSRPTYVLKT